MPSNDVEVDELSRARMSRELDKLGERINPITDAAVEQIRATGKVSVDALGSALAEDLNTLRDGMDRILERYGLKDDELVASCPSSLLLAASMQSRELKDTTENFLLESLNRLAPAAGSTLFFVPPNTPEIDLVNQRAMMIGRLIHHAFLEVFDRVARVAKTDDELQLRQATRDICEFLIRLNWRMSASFIV